MTEKKILDTALTVFAKYGYYGATTRFIADESGFSEVTLFRKFKTKKNLFYTILSKNQDKMLGELDEILANNEFENPRDFLKALMDGVVDLTDKYFDFIRILLNENCEISKKALDTFVDKISHYIEKRFPNSKIDYDVLALTILSFTYFIIFDKIHGRTFIDHTNAVEEFINQYAVLFSDK